MKTAIVWIVFAAIILVLDLVIPESDYAIQFWSCIIVSNVWLAKATRNA